jgi:hypothetical protein
MAARKFWISSQPEMTEQSLEGRIAFFRNQETPMLNDQTRQLLGVE